MFLEGWRRYAEPGMSSADQDRYFAESGDVARLLGADPVPGHARGRRAADPRVPRASLLPNDANRASSAISCSTLTPDRSPKRRSTSC